MMQPDYISPTLQPIDLRHAFPHRIVGDVAASSWPYLRRMQSQAWYVDSRNPTVGFTSADEASLLYNAARLSQGRPCLEVGCWRGWSTAHIAAGAGALDVVDPVLADPEFLADVRASLAAAGVADKVQLIAGFSPDAVESLAEDAAKRWAFAFIDGDHDGDAPRRDAETVARHCAGTAMIMFHDLLSPHVAAGLDTLRDAGWNTGIYHTMQVMGVAWRGDVQPVAHVMDPRLAWELPPHLANHRRLSTRALSAEAEGGQLAEAFRRLLDKHVDMVGSLAAGPAAPAAPEAVATDELDRLHRRLGDMVETIAKADFVAAQHSAALAEAKAALADRDGALAEATARAGAAIAKAAALEASLMDMHGRLSADADAARSLRVALADEQDRRMELSVQLDSSRAAEASAAAMLQRLLAKQAEFAAQAEGAAMPRAAQRLSFDHPASAADDTALVAAHALSGSRMVFGLARRRFTQDAGQTREQFAAVLDEYGIHGAAAEETLDWLMSRRVLVGLLRRNLTGRRSAASWAAFARLRQSLRGHASAHVHNDPRHPTPPADPFRAYHAADSIDRGPPADRDVARFRALELAKLADEQEIFDLRLELLTLQHEAGSSPAAER